MRSWDWLSNRENGELLNVLCRATCGRGGGGNRRVGVGLAARLSLGLGALGLLNKLF